MSSKDVKAEAPRAAGTVPRKPWKRALRYAAVVLLCGVLAAVVMAQLNPKADPARLGEAVGRLTLHAAIAAFVVSWLWFARRRKLAVGAFVVILLVAAVGVVSVRNDARRRDLAFPELASKGFVPTESGRLLRHVALGLEVGCPGNTYETLPVINPDPRTFAWGFRNADEGKSIVVFALQHRLDTAEDVRDYLEGYVNGAKSQDVDITIAKETVAWDEAEPYAEIEGSAGPLFLCVRMFPSGTRYPDFDAVFAAQAYAPDAETARDMARSLRLGGFRSPAPSASGFEP